MENDLSRLSDQIGVIRKGIENPRIGLTGSGFRVLEKAERIIGELAKHASTNLIPQDCYGCGLLKTISKCKEIAAEGGDGR